MGSLRYVRVGKKNKNIQHLYSYKIILQFLLKKLVSKVFIVEFYLKNPYFSLKERWFLET